MITTTQAIDVIGIVNDFNLAADDPCEDTSERMSDAAIKKARASVRRLLVREPWHSLHEQPWATEYRLELRDGRAITGQLEIDRKPASAEWADDDGESANTWHVLAFAKLFNYR